MVTIANNSKPSGLKLESLTHIDISTLSHSELHALSLCSDAAFDLRRTDDVVLSPQIDRAFFNESAGSRRQTYSRLRLDSAVAGHRHRLAGLLPHPNPSDDDHERAENNSIVGFLKQLIAGEGIEISPINQSKLLKVPETTNVDTQTQSGGHEMQIVVHSSERKRKRGRKPKLKVVENGGGVEIIEMEIVNRNGVAVDLVALENADDQFTSELNRRTVGLETEEEVLGFLSNLDGQWGSRRKKRKVVDASEFGDALPIGWKLLLGLRRRERRVSVYCRRYISPIGQQFVCCKEVSSYLQSYFGFHDSSEPMDRSNGNIQQALIAASGSNAGLIHIDNEDKQDAISNSILPSSSLPDEHQKEVSLIEIDNLAEVQVRDLFECYKCNMSFDEKDAYMQHLLSFHQQTTRRYRLGTSVGEGVIIKDGKFECQFCHKVFHERRSYNDHVGIHARNYVRSSEELPVQAVEKHIDSAYQDDLPCRISKMDALIEVAQSSILEPSSSPNAKPQGGPCSDKLPVLTRPEIPATRSSEMEMENSVGEGALSEELDRHRSEHPMTVHTSISEHFKTGMEDKYGNSDLQIDAVYRNSKQSDDVVKENVGQTVEDVPRNGVTEFSIPPGENEFCMVGQTFESLTGFEELRLEEIEPLRFNFVHEQEGFNSSDGFGSEAIMLNMAGENQLTTLCVWCRVPFSFNHESVDSEAQSDSIGFMCPTCKAKISGQINVLDSGLPMNSHQF